MSEFHKLLAVSAWFSNVAFAGPGLDQAEVRLPYAEFKTLISEAVRAAPGLEPVGALLAARFRLSIVGDSPVIDATFRTTTFSNGLAMIPLVGGDVTVESQKPDDARILIHEKMLCHAREAAGAIV